MTSRVRPDPEEHPDLIAGAAVQDADSLLGRG